MSSCDIEIELIMEHHLGRTSREGSERIGRHLAAGCPTCRENLAWVERVLPGIRDEAFMQRVEQSPVLERSVQRAQKLFRDYPPKPKPSLIQSILSFDSRTNLVPSFARGARGETIQQRYSAQGYDIEIWRERLGKGRWYVIGQVIADSSSKPIHPEAAELIPESGRPLPATLTGPEFHLTPVQTGRYRMLLRLSGVDIELSDVSFED